MEGHHPHLVCGMIPCHIWHPGSQRIGMTPEAFLQLPKWYIYHFPLLDGAILTADVCHNGRIGPLAITLDPLFIEALKKRSVLVGVGGAIVSGSKTCIKDHPRYYVFCSLPSPIPLVAKLCLAAARLVKIPCDPKKQA